MAGKTILTDDDPEMLKALSIQLKREGYGVLTALDGMQAVMGVQKNAPDLVILDMRMPAGGGVPVLEKLGGSVQRMGIPVIVLTSFGARRKRQRS